MSTSSPDSRKSKKRRASREPATDLPVGQPPTKRSSNFWFDDGNIVLQTSKTMFRVHKGVLKLHSSVFLDIFATPQAKDQPTIDECPIVALTDDEEDWNILLGALYHIETFYIEGTNVICTTEMLAMLRLGQKYGFERFKEAALEQLRQVYPRTTKQLDVILAISPSTSESFNELQSVPDGDEFKILKTIMKLRIETLLPLAYYFCVRTRSLADIFAGLDVSDSSDDTVHLSTEMKAALIIGKEKILAAYPKLTFSWWYNGKPSATCTSGPTCRKTILTVIQSLTDVTYGVNRALDPYNEDAKLCKACHAEAKAAHLVGRSALIDALPSFFGLRPWDELKDF